LTVHRFAFPTDIRFGAGARREAAAYLAAHGCRRPLIVTDEGIAALPLLAEFKSTLHGLAVEIFSGVRGNPVKSQVDAGVAAFRKHHADAVKIGRAHV
jgi:alcohol dehydrogenase class IV